MLGHPSGSPGWQRFDWGSWPACYGADKRWRDNAVKDYTIRITRLARSHEAVWLLREMQHQGFMPNVITYNAAISACGKGRSSQSALRLLDEMRQSDLVPNVITYNAAISACEKGQVSQSALRLLDEMRHRDLVPDVITYSAAISACEKGQVSDSALRLLDEMRQRERPRARRHHVHCGHQRM